MSIYIGWKVKMEFNGQNWKCILGYCRVECVYPMLYKNKYFRANKIYPCCWIVSVLHFNKVIKQN